jgi:hypothetical protein
VIAGRVLGEIGTNYYARPANSATASAMPTKGRSMRAVLIAILIGAVLAVGAGLGIGQVVAGIGNGKPVNAQLYNYGQR